MKSREEEFVDKLLQEYPSINAFYGDAQSYIFLCETLQKWTKIAYNEALDDVISIPYSTRQGSEILKLKK